MWFRALVLAVVLLAACGGGSGTGSSEDTGTEAGDDPLDFTAGTVRGGQFEGSEHVGEDVVLWFWAPW